jgi:radical SAM superfamily enzyme YgiQ (UPF0313 family)
MNSWEIVRGIRQRIREEEGVLIKPAALRIALCHPSPYAAAMSSLGFQTIYREIHLHSDASAERAFLPENPGEYRKCHLPILTYESETPLSDFPVVAFSISYELELTGILEMLDLSGIPLLARERTEKHPLIIAGGPLTNSNPLILAPFVDLIFVGEGEELINQFIESAAGRDRKEILDRFSSLAGSYVPGMTARVPEGAKVKDDKLPAHSQILTKNCVLASMFLIEPERGCSRNCSYCVMRGNSSGGMRLVSPARVFELIPRNARRVGLVGAAVTDHPGIMGLVRSIVTSGREIGISSLRADRLDGELLRWLAQGGYKTLTTAADGVSQRMRDQVARTITEQHLIRAAEWVHKFRLERLKLYMMVGLPGETLEDIHEMVRFSLELSKIAPLSLSISPFVAKKNTPLDGSPFEEIQIQSSKLSIIRSGLKGSADVKPVSPRWAWVEYKLSQGGESAGLAAHDAWREGGKFSSWKQAFDRHEA